MAIGIHGIVNTFHSKDLANKLVSTNMVG